jgi:hypothetical protein
MTICQLVTRIRKAGGRVWLDPLGRLNAEWVSKTEMSELADSHDLVVALLREEIASKRWGRSRNPKWARVPEQTWNDPEQTLKLRSELVRIWAAEQCVFSSRCCTKTSAVHRAFLGWLGLGPDAVSEQEFLQHLASFGWHSINGWLNKICLADDFGVAWWRLNRGRSLSGTPELQAQAETRANCAQPENGQQLGR